MAPHDIVLINQSGNNNNNEIFNAPYLHNDNLHLCQAIRVTWWRHQMETFSALLAIWEGNSQVPVNSPHKGQWRGTLMFSLICARINCWVSNGEAGDLRHHGAHYYVIVMNLSICIPSTAGHTQYDCGQFGCMNHMDISCEVFDYFSILYDFFMYISYNSCCWSKVHDDVIKCKHFPRNWPFVRGIHRSRWIPHTKASDAELSCFLWSASE